MCTIMGATLRNKLTWLNCEREGKYNLYVMAQIIGSDNERKNLPKILRWELREIERDRVFKDVCKVSECVCVCVCAYVCVRMCVCVCVCV